MESHHQLVWFPYFCFIRLLQIGECYLYFSKEHDLLISCHIPYCSYCYHWDGYYDHLDSEANWHLAILSRYYPSVFHHSCHYCSLSTSWGAFDGQFPLILLDYACREWKGFGYQFHCYDELVRRLLESFTLQIRAATVRYYAIWFPGRYLWLTLSPQVDQTC